MLNNVDIYPTLQEQELLAQKAAQYNLSVSEFILLVLRRAINENNSVHDL